MKIIINRVPVQYQSYYLNMAIGCILLLLNKYIFHLNDKKFQSQILLHKIYYYNYENLLSSQIKMKVYCETSNKINLS